MFALLIANSAPFIDHLGHDETYTQSFEQISERISELEKVGGSRILMQGGVNPSLEFSWYLELISYHAGKTPWNRFGLFQPN